MGAESLASEATTCQLVGSFIVASVVKVRLARPVGALVQSRRRFERSELAASSEGGRSEVKVKRNGLVGDKAG
jgi:hypothetical protein